jgi:hypothetical protein
VEFVVTLDVSKLVVTWLSPFVAVWKSGIMSEAEPFDVSSAKAVSKNSEALFPAFSGAETVLVAETATRYVER